MVQVHGRVTKLVTLLLCSVAAVQFFGYYGYYEYKSVSKGDIDKYLYKYVNPHVVRNGDKPDCEYERVYQQEFDDEWPRLDPDDTFDAEGIVNGSYVPASCNPRLSVAVLVTYRNRQSQLNIFIPFIHNFLRRQNIHYKIFIIAQQDENLFNKGLLYNIGARQASAEQFPCLVLHDIDLLPLNNANLYACLHQPRHLSAMLDKFRFVLPYETLVGGVLAITTDQFKQLNGFSNRFTGWGGEDDEFASRILSHNLEILRLPPDISRYTMLIHKQEAKNRDRFWLISENDSEMDGLNSLSYQSVSFKQHRLFTLINVNT